MPTGSPPRDARGRFSRTRPPDYVVQLNDRGHLHSVHGQGWHFEVERRVPAWLWVALGLVCGWTLAAICLAQMVGR